VIEDHGQMPAPLVRHASLEAHEFASYPSGLGLASCVRSGSGRATPAKASMRLLARKDQVPKEWNQKRQCHCDTGQNRHRGGVHRPEGTFAMSKRRFSGSVYNCSKVGA
jgi:hypothetical protein